MRTLSRSHNPLRIDQEFVVSVQKCMISVLPMVEKAWKKESKMEKSCKSKGQETRTVLPTVLQLENQMDFRWGEE